MENVDLAVIGTGSAGASAAYAVREAGRSVAIIDERPFGGTCALRGCDPKKVLVGAAELVDWSRRMDGSGTLGESRIAWSDMMRFKQSFTDPVPADRESGFRASGISTYHGSASFVDDRTLRVGDELLRAHRVVIATGAAPITLGIPGEEHLLTSDDFLELPNLPERVAFVGGGYIAFEFAHIAARANAHCVILHRGSRVLEGFDEAMVSQLVTITGSIGVDVRVRSEVTAIERSAGGFRVHVRGAEENSIIECDLAIHAAGRRPNLVGLDLEKAGITYNHAGVTVNEYLQSVSNPVVYAGGDAADSGGLRLTPVAGDEGDLIARNILDGNRHTTNFSGLASIAYTIPSLGMVGMTESQARSQGLHFAIHEGDSTRWYSSRRIQARHSSYRILVENETNQILGAHVLGPHTEELVNMFALAIRERIPATRLSGELFAYPTASSDIRYMLG